MSDAQSFLPRMAKVRKRRTLDAARDPLNKWYAAHVDQLNRRVTVCLEIVLPELRKTHTVELGPGHNDPLPQRTFCLRSLMRGASARHQATLVTRWRGARGAYRRTND